LTVLRKGVLCIAEQMFGVTKQKIADPTESAKQKGRKAYFKGNTNINFVTANMRKI